MSPVGGDMDEFVKRDEPKQIKHEPYCSTNYMSTDLCVFLLKASQRAKTIQ